MLAVPLNSVSIDYGKNCESAIDARLMLYDVVVAVEWQHGPEVSEKVAEPCPNGKHNFSPWPTVHSKYTCAPQSFSSSSLATN
jgi:hypothetical protein